MNSGIYRAGNGTWYIAVSGHNVGTVNDWLFFGGMALMIAGWVMKWWMQR